MTEMKLHEATDTHKQFRDALAEVTMAYAASQMEPVEVLAVMSNLMGGVLAIQSQLTVDSAIEVIIANVRNGFNLTSAHIAESQGGAASNQTGGL